MNQINILVFTCVNIANLRTVQQTYKQTPLSPRQILPDPQLVSNYEHTNDVISARARHICFIRSHGPVTDHPHTLGNEVRGLVSFPRGTPA
jgi:hypothetical protein